MLVEIFDYEVGVSLSQIIDLCEVCDVIITKLEEILAPYQLLFRDVRICLPPSSTKRVRADCCCSINASLNQVHPAGLSATLVVIKT